MTSHHRESIRKPKLKRDRIASVVDYRCRLRNGGFPPVAFYELATRIAARGSRTMTTRRKEKRKERESGEFARSWRDYENFHLQVKRPTGLRALRPRRSPHSARGSVSFQECTLSIQDNRPGMRGPSASSVPDRRERHEEVGPRPCGISLSLCLLSLSLFSWLADSESSVGPMHGVRDTASLKFSCNILDGPLMCGFR